MSRSDNTLVRAIGRIPATVQRKLLVALALVGVLLVAVGVLGLAALDTSNDRVATLGALPQRVAAYEDLSLYGTQLDEDLITRDNLVIPCNSGDPCPTDEAQFLEGTDTDIDYALDALSKDFTKIGRIPDVDVAILRQIKAEYAQISGLTISFHTDSVKPFPALPFTANVSQEGQAANLEGNAATLVTDARSAAATLTEQNQRSYLDSQHLFIGVAAASLVLALIVGLALSWSLTGPIRKMDTRLAAIAAGDFSGHVDVTNRDELGALATNLNRMNDELVRLYQELENASKHKSEFLANMSHELRTPLNAVIGFSEVLEGRLFGDLNEKQAEYVTDIHTSGRHLLTLINDILDLSKIEAGRMDLQVTPFLFAEVVRNSVALLRERATRQGTALGFEVSDSVGVVEADERMIKQVLFNLLTNALKFTPRGGHVDVSVQGGGGDVVVSVRDDGIGIAAADQVRIFDEFQQVGTSQLQEGTGLGLAISRRFVELHGGRLWVESAPGRGSAFTFTLPRAQGPGTAEAAAMHVNATAALDATAPLP